MARYTADLQKDFRRTKGDDTTIIPSPRNQEVSRSFITPRRIGILAAAALAGLAAGIMTTPQGNGNANNQAPTMQADGILPQQPKILQEPTNTTESPKTIFGPTDFSLDFKEYTTEDGCKSFGSIVVKDQVLTAQIGAQPYAITIASATTEFYTCTNDAKVTYKNGELDTDKNTYPEIVALDVTSLTYGAVLKNVNLSMKPVTPKEQLKDEGTDKEACIIFNVCKIDTSKIAELPKEVTDVVLASAKAQIVSTAQETFAKVEHKAMIEDAVNELLKQADELQVSRELVQFALVNGKGAVVNAVPNYGSPLLKTTLKNENAAITNKDLKGIFGEVSIEMEYIPNESPRG